MVRARSTTSIHSDKHNHLSIQQNAPRALSVQHTGQTPVSNRASGDLRHTAIRNGLLRSGSGNNVLTAAAPTAAAHPGTGINKNIPMLQVDTKLARNLGNRWTNFTISQNEQKPPPVPEPVEQETTRTYTKASVSPLTYVKGSAATSSQTENTTFLSPPTTPTTDNKFDDLHSDEALDSHLAKSRQTVSSRLYKRMSLLIHVDRRTTHDSMHSLAPMTRYASELDTSEDEAETGDTDTERDHEHEGTLHLTSMDMSNAVSVMDMMKEINDFQTTFVDRNSPQRGNATSTRTQQKLLDLRDLIGDDLELPAPGFVNLLDYSVKIQHEAILSEWTQIRLRFSSHLTSRTGTNISCHAGVLGFAHRYKDRMFVHPESHVTRDNVYDYIQEMWDSEVVRLTVSPKRVVLPTFDDDIDIYKENQTLMSSLARNVMLSRETTHLH